MIQHGVPKSGTETFEIFFINKISRTESQFKNEKSLVKLLTPEDSLTISAYVCQKPFLFIV